MNAHRNRQTKIHTPSTAFRHLPARLVGHSVSDREASFSVCSREQAVLRITVYSSNISDKLCTCTIATASKTRGGGGGGGETEKERTPPHHTHTHARTHAHMTQWHIPSHTHTKTHIHTHWHTHWHTHTHTAVIQYYTQAHTYTQTDGSEGQCGLTEIFWEEKCLELTFEGRESSRVPDVLGEIVPDVGAKVWESAKAMGFAVEALDFKHACVWRRAERAGRTVKV